MRLGICVVASLLLAACSDAGTAPQAARASDSATDDEADKATVESTSPQAESDSAGAVGGSQDVVPVASLPASLLYNPVEPVRALDTRQGPAVDDRSTRDIAVAGKFGVPANASAVALHVAAVPGSTTSKGGYLAAYAAGQYAPDKVPTFSNINYMAQETIGNMVVVPVGDNGSVTVLNHGGPAHLVADVLGYFTNGDASGTAACALHMPKVAVKPVTTRLAAAGWAEFVIPEEFKALKPSGVFVSITSNATANGWVGLSGIKLASPPKAVNMNYRTGEQIVSSTALLREDRIYAYSSTANSLTVTFNGACSGAPGGYGFRFVEPVRVYDSRNPAQPPPGAGATLAIPVTMPKEFAGLLTNVALLGVTEATHVALDAAKHWTVAGVPGAVRAGAGFALLQAAEATTVALYNQTGTPNVIVDVFAGLVPR